MACSRQITKLFRANLLFTYGSRNFHAKRPDIVYSRLRPLILGGLAVGAGFGIYSNSGQLAELKKFLSSATTVNAKEDPPKCETEQIPESQPSVFSPGKNHALYLTIHLKPTADVKECANAVARLPLYVNEIVPEDMRDEDDEIWAGVGFGPNFLSQIAGKPIKNFVYSHRKGKFGEMPSTGGDIFIHAKSNTLSKLFQLCQKVMMALPENSVKNFEDIYSFVYKNGRDLSGFIDGTENPADDESRQEVAVEPETGGSYVITQKWHHKMDVIEKEKECTMERWVGRTRPDSTELPKKTHTAHVSRMTGGSGFGQPKTFEIVRQSMPFGSLHDKCGLFFIGYAASPENFEFMLDRMVGAGGDGRHDDIMRLSECVTGTYWFFPGAKQLEMFKLPEVAKKK